MRKRIEFAVIVVASVTLVAACSGDSAKSTKTADKSSPSTASKPASDRGHDTKPASEAKPAAKAEPKPAGDSAAAPKAASGDSKIAGKVSFAGEPPTPRPIRMSADPYCDSQHPDGATRRGIVVGKDKGLSGTFVHVKEGLGDAEYDAPSDSVKLDQLGCRYEPRVVGVQVGQPIEIMNSDATLHNVNAQTKNSKGFNLGMPTKGQKSTKKFSAPEVFVRMKCDVHPWMESFIGVTSHPFFAVTEDDGSFELSGLAAGKYIIEAVHPMLGSKQTAVEVAEGGAASADFSFSR